MQIVFVAQQRIEVHFASNCDAQNIFFTKRNVFEGCDGVSSTLINWGYESIIHLIVSGPRTHGALHRRVRQ